MKQLFLSFLALLYAFCLLVPTGLEAETDLREYFPKSGSGRASAEELVIGPFTFTDLKAEVSVEPLKVILHNCSASVGGGGATGTVSIDLTSNKPTYQGSFDIFNVSAQEFGNMILVHTPLLAGTMNASIEVSGIIGDPLSTKVLGTVSMKGAGTDIVSYATARLTFIHNKVTLSDIELKPALGGTVTGILTISPDSDRTGNMIGELNATSVCVESISSIFGKEIPWLSGNMTGNIDLRLHWENGKTMYFLSGNISDMLVEVFKNPIAGTASYEYSDSTFVLRDIKGTVAEGSVLGSVSFSGNQFQIDSQCENVQLKQVLENLGVKDPVAGKVKGGFSASIQADDININGKGYFSIKEGNLGSAPGIVSVVSLIPIPSFSPHDFTEARANLTFKDKRILVDNFQIASKRLTLDNGEGYVDLDGKLKLLLEPHSETNPISAIFSKLGLDPTSKIFKVEVSNTIFKPESSLKAFARKVNDTEGLEDNDKPDDTTPDKKEEQKPVEP